ncbi:MAG: hypothetical protein U1E96_02555 [Azonexus sp.]
MAAISAFRSSKPIRRSASGLHRQSASATNSWRWQPTWPAIAEAASVANAVLPDDGARQAVLDSLGITDIVSQTAETPLAPADRSYPANTLFEQATQQLPRPCRHRADERPGGAVLSPFYFARLCRRFWGKRRRHRRSALVGLPDGSFLTSAGRERNEVYRYDRRRP